MFLTKQRIQGAAVAVGALLAAVGVGWVIDQVLARFHLKHTVWEFPVVIAIITGAVGAVVLAVFLLDKCTGGRDKRERDQEER